MTNGATNGSLGEPIRSTSAPCAASVRPQVGPASTRVRSSARIPASGRAPGGSGSGGLSPTRITSTTGQLGERAALRVRRPLVRAARARAAQPAFGERVLERLRVPARDRRRELRPLRAAAEQRQRLRLRAGEALMEQEPLAVASRIEVGELRARIERPHRGRLLEPLVDEAEQRRRSERYGDAVVLCIYWFGISSASTMNRLVAWPIHENG